LSPEAVEKRDVTAGILTRVCCGLLGLIALFHAILGKGSYRWGLYDFDDDSDIPIDRRIGRAWEAVIGVAFILAAILVDGSKWTE
jgi:hypothetical protein